MQDGNGAVDLNEFLIGMTSEAANMSIDDNARESASLQQAFQEFANLHRRNVILERLYDTSSGASDAKRYSELGKLFTICYFKQESKTDGIVGTVMEQIQQAKEIAAAEKKEFGAEARRQRQLESLRAREAVMQLQTEADMRSHSDRADPQSVVSALSKMRLDNEEATALRLQTRLNRSLKVYSHPDTMPRTFAPPLSSVQSLRDLRSSARSTAHQLRKSASTVMMDTAIRILPPVSNRQRIELSQQQL